MEVSAFKSLLRDLIAFGLVVSISGSAFLFGHIILSAAIVSLCAPYLLGTCFLDANL